MSPRSKATTQKEIAQAQREINRLAKNAVKTLLNSKAYKVLRAAEPEDLSEEPIRQVIVNELKQTYRSNKDLGEACEQKAMEIYSFLETAVLPQHYKLIGYMVDLFIAPYQTRRPVDNYFEAYEWQLRKANDILLAVRAEKPQRRAK